MLSRCSWLRWLQKILKTCFMFPFQTYNRWGLCKPQVPAATIIGIIWMYPNYPQSFPPMNMLHTWKISLRYTGWNLAWNILGKVKFYLTGEHIGNMLGTFKMFLAWTCDTSTCVTMSRHMFLPEKLRMLLEFRQLCSKRNMDLLQCSGLKIFECSLLVCQMSALGKVGRHV